MTESNVWTITPSLMVEASNSALSWDFITTTCLRSGHWNREGKTHVRALLVTIPKLSSKGTSLLCNLSKFTTKVGSKICKFYVGMLIGASFLLFHFLFRNWQVSDVNYMLKVKPPSNKGWILGLNRRGQNHIQKSCTTAIQHGACFFEIITKSRISKK